MSQQAWTGGTTVSRDHTELHEVIYGYFGPSTAINSYKSTDQQDHELTDVILAAGWVKPRTITTVAELDALRFGSIVALVSHSRNIPMVIVFQKGSLEHGGGGWCTPEAIGQIPAEAVFEFIALNGYPQELTVLHEVTL